MKKSDGSDFKTVLIIGSGPIVIGQAVEFDYSGTQACKALREEGYRVVLLNSNPATIMTDPATADATYIEPIDPSTTLEIIKKEGVDAILPTMGGQTGLNLVLALSKIPEALDRVKILGANLKSIHLAEDRKAFREVLKSLEMDSPRSTIVRSIEETRKFAEECGYPFIFRPSFTMGGTGQSFIYSEDELEDKTSRGLSESPIGEALVEESVLGWKEYELEVMRDCQDNAIVVCSIENIDPMGVHTGDSLTVAPAQTLTDREYQDMRRDALALIRRVGVETGGCNVQFAVCPKTGRRIVIEMNPRVSRSSALASKATGFPIAFVATKLALGYTLSEIENSVTQTTKACFEPPLDYVAVKIPRWHFEKFPGTKDELLPQMQSVGEVLAFGSSFAEAMHKGLMSLEKKSPVFPAHSFNGEKAKIEWEENGAHYLTRAHSGRAFAVWDALASGASPDWVVEKSVWAPWFVNEIRNYQIENKIGAVVRDANADAECRFEMIDTSAGEIAARTPYFYSSREKLGKTTGDLATSKVPELPTEAKGRVVILGSGPNRIGQGVEFDYCCVHAALSLRNLGYEAIMHNCNPETVSTDPATSTRLYLEPLTATHVRSVLKHELDPVRDSGRPAYVLLQMGGQTPLKLAKEIESWGYQVLGSSNESIDLCEDRARFADILEREGFRYPQFRQTRDHAETLSAGEEMGFPVLVRPSFVLGGRAMRICANQKDLSEAFAEAKLISEEHPLYMDRFLIEAIEFDIDGICDGKKAWVAGVMEHVEEAGVHSGDSSCVIPPFRLPPEKIDEMAGIAKQIAVATGAKGLFNIQMAVVGDEIYVIEANPRASRTIPFLSKATGYPIIEWGLRAALGEPIEEVVDKSLIPGNYRLPGYGYAVKVPVFPFNKFKDFDPILGPEMRSTGEVMGMASTAGEAFAKAYSAAGTPLPTQGQVLFSVRNSDKKRCLQIARLFEILGFELLGTPGTARFLSRAGLNCESVEKIACAQLGERDLLDVLRGGGVQLIVNTTTSTGAAIRDGASIRMAATRYRIPIFTTLSGAEIASMAIQTLMKKGIRPISLQSFIASQGESPVDASLELI